MRYHFTSFVTANKFRTPLPLKAARTKTLNIRKAYFLFADKYKVGDAKWSLDVLHLFIKATKIITRTKDVLTIKRLKKTQKSYPNIMSHANYLLLF
jgi:hypothetical protein